MAPEPRRRQVLCRRRRDACTLVVDPDIILTSLVALAGYVCGSVPFAYLLVRRSRNVDLRTQGSGNVGATNVLRTTNPRLAGLVVALDAAKGAISVLLCSWAGLGVQFQAVAGVAAVVGHIYPVWLRFRGGKGVATATGVFMLLSPMVTVLAIGIFAAVVALTWYVSLGSVSAVAVVAPLALLSSEPLPVVWAAATTAAMVIFRHRSNLARLVAGTERRIRQRA